MKVREASIIVLNKNRIELLKDCLDSIEEYTKDVDYKLYIIDAGSVDGSREYIFTNYQEKADLIFESEQTNYAECNNRVMRMCNTPYIYLLNNDCLVTSGWLRNAIDFAEKDKTIGHVASLVLWDKEKVQSHGANLTKIGDTIICFQGLNKNDSRLKEIKNYAYGGLGLYRKDILEKYGYIPEYPCKIYWADVSSCMRTWEVGYDVRYCPDSVVIHLLHDSERKGHCDDTDKGRQVLLAEYGKFLEENNGFEPDYPFTGKRPYRGKKF